MSGNNKYPYLVDPQSELWLNVSSVSKPAGAAQPFLQRAAMLALQTLC